MSELQTAETGEWALIVSHLPGRSPEPIGVLLRDIVMDRLHVKLRNEWWTAMSEEDDVGIWRELGEDLERMSRDVSSGQFLHWLETSASHVVQISERAELQTEDFDAAVESLYDEHVRTPEVRRDFIPEMVLTEPSTFLELRSSTPHAISRPNQGSLFRKRWAFTAIAASAIGMIQPWEAKRVLPSAPALRESTYNPIALPLGFDLRAADLLLKVELAPGALHLTYRHPRKLRKSSYHPQKMFRSERLLPQTRPIQIAQIESHPIQIADDVNPVASLNFALPQPVQFRNRRNRFIRLVSLLVAPFRAQSEYHNQFPKTNRTEAADSPKD